jgi:U3 small nucleolar RNA-associated protein 14
VGNTDIVDESLYGSKLANLKFMRKADAGRKKVNDAMVEDIRRELAGEDSPSEEEEDSDVGRRIFGPGKNQTQHKMSVSKTNEFEEPVGSGDEEDIAELEIHGLDADSRTAPSLSRSKKTNGASKSLELPSSKTQRDENSAGGAWSKVPSKSNTISDSEAKKRRHKKNNAIDVEELDLSKAAVIATQPKPKKPKKVSTLDLESDSEESNDDNAVRLPFAIRDQELIKRAFAGADVVGEFEAEKKQTIEDEDEKVIDNTLPGWGNWVGEGISKREKARNKGRFLTKSEGIKEQNRKDAKLERVIINEKRIKKVCLFVIGRFGSE